MKFERMKRQEKTQPYEYILIFLLMVSAWFLIVDSFVYFYSYYIWYSFALVVVGCFVFCNWLPKKKKKVFSDFYYLLVPAILTIYIFWFAPKIIHFVSLPKNICFNAILTYKQYFYTQNQTGMIKFYLIEDANNKPPKELKTLNKLSAIPEKEYNNLPSTGKKIEICGTLSSIGFSFDYVDGAP